MNFPFAGKVLLFLMSICACHLSGFTDSVQAQVEPASEEGEKKDSSIGPVPKVDLGDDSLNSDFERFHRELEERNISKALASIKRLKSKMRKAQPPISDALERCFKEAQAGVVLDKATRYFDKGRMKQALAIIEKEDPTGTAFEGSLIGEEVAEMRQTAFEDVYLLLADFEKSTASSEDSEEEEEEGEEEGAGRRDRGGQQGRNFKIIGGSREDGDVRNGKFAMHWQTGDNLSWVTIGEDVFRKLVDEGVSLTDYRYLRISIRCEDPKARPQLLFLFDAEGGQVNPPRGGGRRGASRAFQRNGYNSALVPKGRWQDLRLDLKKFTRKGDVDWDMVEAFRIVFTGGPDSLIMIDDVRLEKP